MPPFSLPISGACRCGRVAIRVTKPPLVTSACHCRGCQKMSSSAYSLTAVIPSEGFEVTKGEPVIGGLHGADTHHHFCGHCMTWMFTRPEGKPSARAPGVRRSKSQIVGFSSASRTAASRFVNVRPTLLDDASWFRPFMETYTSTKLAFAETGAVRSFAEFPRNEEYEGLMAEYRAWVGTDADG